MRPRLICTGLNGTLVDSTDGETVSATFFERLRRERQEGPLLWAIITGMSWPEMESLMLRKNFPVWPNWIVTLEREIWLIRGKSGIGWYEWNRKCELLHQQLFATITPVWAKIETWVREKTRAIISEEEGGAAVISGYDSDEADRINAFMEPLIKAWPQLVVRRSGNDLRFCHSHYDKGTCLRGIAQGLGMNPFDILAAGDHHSDLSMLQRRHAQFLVCPANATDEVKAQVKREHGIVAEGCLVRGLLEGWDAIDNQWK